MRHVRLAEAFGYLQREVLIINVDHRPLAKRGQRLVRRLSRIDPDASSRGIRAQGLFEQRLIAVVAGEVRLSVERNLSASVRAASIAVRGR